MACMSPFTVFFGHDDLALLCHLSKQYCLRLKWAKADGGGTRRRTTIAVYPDAIGPVTTDNSPSGNRTVISRSSKLWSASNSAGSDPESLVAVSTSLRAALTSSLEDVGLGMSLDPLRLRTPFFVLSCSFCFSASTTSLHLRVGFSSPKPSSSSPPGRWGSAFESLCKANTWSATFSSLCKATCLGATPVCLIVYHKFGAMRRGAWRTRRI